MSVEQTPQTVVPVETASDDDVNLDTERSTRPHFILLIVGLLVALGILGINPLGAYEPNLAIGVLVVVVLLVFGFSLIPRGRPQKTDYSQLERVVDLSKFSAVPQVAADAPAAATPAAAGGEAKAPKDLPLKPVAFDKTIAATGVSILYGTESGNSEELARMAATELQGAGFTVQVLDNGVIDARHLPAFANMLVLTSTWGEGDPPSNTVDLMAQLKSDLPLDLAGAQFSVLSLGDTNYEQFCKCGKDFDNIFEKNGAERFFKRVDCDLDYETPFHAWVLGVKDELKSRGLKTKPEYAPPTEAAPEPVAV